MTQRCRVCGCSNLSACEGGCYWVDDDLCSSCVTPRDVDVATGGTGTVVGWAGPGVPIVELDVEYEA